MLVDKLHIFSYKRTFYLLLSDYCKPPHHLLSGSHFLIENTVIITKTSFFIQSEDSSPISNTDSMAFSV